MSYRKARPHEQPSRALRGGTLLTRVYDMNWLREVHLPKLAAEYQSAVMYGNEDAPEQIECYLAAEPEVTDWPQIWIPA